VATLQKDMLYSHGFIHLSRWETFSFLMLFRPPSWANPFNQVIVKPTCEIYWQWIDCDTANYLNFIQQVLVFPFLIVVPGVNKIPQNLSKNRRVVCLNRASSQWRGFSCDNLKLQGCYPVWEDFQQSTWFSFFWSITNNSYLPFLQ
jgi:hypothetical protein